MADVPSSLGVAYAWLGVVIGKAEKNEFQTRLVCFDLDKRGRNGETLLHLCFSNGSFLHMLIARRLLEIYPNTIKDICISDEYYGRV